MPDVTQDFTDDGFHEIHLSGKQLVFLFMATTVVAVVVFLCGVVVGRSVSAEQAAADSLAVPTVAAAPAPPPAVADSGPQAAEPPAPPAEAGELTYKERLEGDARPERLRSVPPPARERNPEPSREPIREPARQPAVIPPPTAKPAQAQGTVTAPPASQPSAAETAQAPETGSFVVQVHALKDRNVANGMVKRLAAKGYPAFVAASAPPASIYRVQVGRFKDRNEAQRVVERLKKEERFDSWITH